LNFLHFSIDFWQLLLYNGFMSTTREQMTTLTVGQKVHLVHGNSYLSFVKGEVVKITPSGLVDIQVGKIGEGNPLGRTIRLNKDGYEQGAQRYGSMTYFLDFISFEERIQAQELEQRTKHAANTIYVIKREDGVNYKWGKDGLQAEVARLQVLLDLAKEAVEAI
jgi:hypothetical protein